jgi:hypothetical protein
MFHKKTALLIFAAILAIITIGGSIIVSSQINQNRAEVSSPSGPKQKPDNLREVPGSNNRRNDRTNITLHSFAADNIFNLQVALSLLKTVF